MARPTGKVRLQGLQEVQGTCTLSSWGKQRGSGRTRPQAVSGEAPGGDCH